ncbi:MAG: hypothetical protein K2R98_26075 [Gemmataceae bacterium]|nr:hypothetical protein [Gemmataceae bacterium]
MFFEQRDEVHKTMRRLARRLERAGIPYALVGGMAVNAHGHQRTTGDVDFLVTAAGLKEFSERFVPKHYQQLEGRPRRFKDRANNVSVDFLVAGMYPGSGKPGPISYPDPERTSQLIKKLRVINLQTLITLKLSARRHQDFADVVSLITAHDLAEPFLDQLHPALHQDFIECLEEKRREDEYEARQ